jgi:hypothetical protein
VVLSAFADRPGTDNPGLFVLTAVAAIAVPLGLLAVMRRDVSWLRGRDAGERAPVAWVAIGVAAAQAVASPLLPYIDGWTPIGIWAGVYLLLILVIVMDVAPRIVRPTGWTGIKAGGRRVVPIVLLAGFTLTFLLMYAAVETTIRDARQPCDPSVFYCVDAPSDAWQGAVGPVWFGGWSTIVVGAFALRLRFIALAAVAMAAFGYGLYAQQIWREIDFGAAVVADPLRLIVAQVAGAVALTATAAVIQIYEQRERTPEELWVLRKLGAKGTTVERSVW